MQHRPSTCNVTSGDSLRAQYPAANPLSRSIERPNSNTTGMKAKRVRTRRTAVVHRDGAARSKSGRPPLRRTGLARLPSVTAEDRVAELSPRALEVLRRQLAMIECLRSRGLIDHDFLFVTADGRPMAFTRDYSIRWRQSIAAAADPISTALYGATHFRQLGPDDGP